MRLAVIHRHLDAARKIRERLQNFTDDPDDIPFKWDLIPGDRHRKNHERRIRRLKHHENEAFRLLIDGLKPGKRVFPHHVGRYKRTAKHRAIVARNGKKAAAARRGKPQPWNRDT